MDDSNKIFRARHNIKMQNPKNKETVMKTVLSDYLSNTSLHGIVYLGKRTQNWIEKTWWIVAFTLSLTCCAYLMSEIWLKWVRNPVILSFEQEQTSIWTIPFPAVTICPTTKIALDRYNYSTMFKKKDELVGDEYKKFWDISLICHLDRLENAYLKLDTRMNFTDLEAIKNIKSAVIKSENIIYKMRWKNKSVQNIGGLFFNQLTEEGICFTFNSLSQEDMFTKQIDPKITYVDHNKTNSGWTLENGYAGKPGKDDYPTRTAGNGERSGMTIYLFTPTDTLDFACGSAVNGYKIILHSPVETPRPNHEYIYTSMDSAHVITISPLLTTTSETLKTMDSRVRKCYFSHEKTLKFFKTYTQNNCKIECEANITKHNCGCVQFHVPRESTTAICGISKVECVSNLQYKMMLMEISNNPDNSEITSEEYEIFSQCDCLPSCSNLKFSTETSQAQLKLADFLRTSELTVQKQIEETKNQVLEGKIKLTKVHIFYKETQFLALRRSELFGRTDFFANIGGLLGLFLGFSVLSLVEMIYFLTLKTWSKMRHRNQVIEISGPETIPEYRN